MFIKSGGVRGVTAQEIRNVPLPKPLARLLRKLRKKAKFNGDEDFVFANRIGNNPLDSVDIFRRHLHPVSDSLGIPRRSIAKMERACAVLASQAGLTSEQMEIVLRVRRGHRRFPPPTPADIEATRVALARAIQLVLPPPVLAQTIVMAYLGIHKLKSLLFPFASLECNLNPVSIP